MHMIIPIRYGVAKVACQFETYLNFFFDNISKSH